MTALHIELSPTQIASPAAIMMGGAGDRKATGARATPAGAGTQDALARLAHDLRGPLANLALIIEALGTAGAGSPQAERVARAGRLVERLDAMLKGALDRARTPVEAPACRRELVDVVDLVETVAALNRPLAEKAGVRLHCFLADPLTTAGDPDLLMRALDNLLANAISFTRTGGLVRCEAAPAANGDVLIRITDEGPGLTREDIAGLFRPGFRAQGRAERPRRSHGLGLANVREIAEAHGGAISASSRGPGHGASFLLRLPADGQVRT